MEPSDLIQVVIALWFLIGPALLFFRGSRRWRALSWVIAWQLVTPPADPLQDLMTMFVSFLFADQLFLHLRRLTFRHAPDHTEDVP